MERPSRTNPELVNLLVELSARTNLPGLLTRSYRARARISFGGDTSDDVRAVISDTEDTIELDSKLYDFFSLVRQTSRVTRAGSRASVGSAQLLGHQLFESLFGGKLGRAYGEARAWSSAKPGRRLRLGLRLPYDDPVVRLPWELLYEGGSRVLLEDFVALIEGTTVVRELDEFPSRPLLEPLEETLRVLLVAYSDGEHRYDVTGEFEAIRYGLGEYGDVRILSDTEATVEGLEHEVESYQPHVVHYLGTGKEEDTSTGAQAILLRDNNKGLRSLVDARRLENVLRSARYLRFVFLNACNTDWVAVKLGRWVPAVIGVLGEYTDTSAVAFARRLYRECGQGAGLEQALSIARRELNYSYPGSLEWSAPVLYVRNFGSTLVRVRSAPLAEPAIAPRPVVAGVEAMEAQTGRDPEREYLAARLEVDRRNRTALEGQIRQLGSQLPPALQAQLDQLRQRIAETEAALAQK